MQKNDAASVSRTGETDRHAHPSLVAYADLVTEMNEVKHPYRQQGIRAQPGIEF